MKNLTLLKNVIYIVAISLLLASIYLKSHSGGNHQMISIAAYIMFGVAIIFHFWVAAKQKKEINN